ncbi:hypothetical protein LTQ03_05900 [Vibrio splendidus]|uniref:hypothetical protein n=1 Tax=Vibrio splendidus TaxID=29497 RepID=UPI001FB1F8C5|nr:hypothetical protein [Vibrio splendidus]UOE80917.1 hypothetical protein LTQ03_05900 [Vibrio splendidus]
MIGKSSFLIVLYDKNFNDSKTINNLLKHKAVLENSDIYIFNNGPNYLKPDLEMDFGNCNVVIEQDLSNKSLSEIYNKFVEKFCSSRYVFLDDDSELTREYVVNAVNVTSEELAYPVIEFEGGSFPNVLNSPYFELNKLIGNYLPEDLELVTIMSGIVLGAEFMKVIKQHYGQVFDERFTFYGVDTSFCYRVNYLRSESKIKLISGFPHDLSKVSDTPISNFKRDQNSIAVALMLREYEAFPKSLCKLTMWVIVEIYRLLLFKDTNQNLFILIKVFVLGIRNKL